MPKRSEQTQHEIDAYRNNLSRKLGGAQRADAVQRYAQDCDKRDQKKTTK